MDPLPINDPPPGPSAESRSAADLDGIVAELAALDLPGAELAEFEAALHGLAYAAPIVPMASDLKQRLLQRIGSTRPVAIVPSSPELAPLLDWSLADLAAAAAGLDWQPLPGMASGEMALWRIDRANNQVASFVRAAGRDRFPAHVHDSGEVLVVVSGDFSDGDRTYCQGDRLYSMAASLHQPTTESGCLVLSISSLDDRFL